jgi:short-subunit dehydrogenase
MDKVAFVTGASSGLGRGLARRLARDGYAVGLAARRVERLEALAEEIRAGGGRAHVCPCDVSVRTQVLEAVAEATEALGPVDLLVANAGYGDMVSARSLDGEAVERMVRVNFFGAVYAVEAVLPAMLERNHGHLVAMGSLAGYNGLPKSAAYSASKGAMHNFFESLRLDLVRTGVAVTMVTPGYVRTELTDKSKHPMPQLLELDDAVDRIMGAIRKRKRVCAFPRPLSTLVWLGQMFPAWLYDALVSGVPRDKRP